MRIVIWHFFEETTRVKNFLRLSHLYLPRFLARNVTTKCRLPFKSSCMYKKGGYIMNICTVQQYDFCKVWLKHLVFIKWRLSKHCFKMVVSLSFFVHFLSIHNHLPCIFIIYFSIYLFLQLLSSWKKWKNEWFD